MTNINLRSNYTWLISVNVSDIVQRLSRGTQAMVSVMAERDVLWIEKEQSKDNFLIIAEIAARH